MKGLISVLAQCGMWLLLIMFLSFVAMLVTSVWVVLVIFMFE